MKIKWIRRRNEVSAQGSQHEGRLLTFECPILQLPVPWRTAIGHWCDLDQGLTFPWKAITAQSKFGQAAPTEASECVAQYSHAHSQLSNFHMVVSYNRGTPSHHPFLDGIFPCKPSIVGFSYGFPMVWGTPLQRLIRGYILGNLHIAQLEELSGSRDRPWSPKKIFPELWFDDVFLIISLKFQVSKVASVYSWGLL